MNIQEKAEQHAREKLGDWGSVVHSAYETNECTNSEISVQDYTAGYTTGFNEAKRWILVSEREPMCYMSGNWDGKKSDEVLVKLKDGSCETGTCYTGFMDGSNFCYFLNSSDFDIDNVTHWREI